MFWMRKESDLVLVLKTRLWLLYGYFGDLGGPFIHLKSSKPGYTMKSETYFIIKLHENSYKHGEVVVRCLFPTEHGLETPFPGAAGACGPNSKVLSLNNFNSSILKTMVAGNADSEKEFRIGD